MKEYIFHTNINCARCVKSVSGFINEVAGIESWEVDTSNDQKPLKVTTKEDLDPNTVAEAVEEAGFDIQLVQ